MDCFIVSERSVLKFMALPLEHAISTIVIAKVRLPMKSGEARIKTITTLQHLDI
jgi:hypothetical protein